MEDKHLVFLPDDVHKELEKIGKDFNDADAPETIAILIYSFYVMFHLVRPDVHNFGNFFDCERNQFSGKNNRLVIGTVPIDESDD